MQALSNKTTSLVLSYQKWQKSLSVGSNIATIHVDEVAAKVAAFYEKIRGIIDWKEEHLLKRRAIERTLKRRLFTKLNLDNGNIEESSEIAESLVLELIRGGHFPNDKIAESKIADVQRSIDKYIFILNNTEYKKKRSRIELYSWISSIAACEIEEILDPSIKERALMNYMFEVINQKIKVNGNTKMDETEKSIQVFVATGRALFNLDSSIISYYLLKYRYQGWNEKNSFKEDIYAVKNSLDYDLNHPLGDKFYKICEKYDTPFLLLGDVLAETPEEGEKILSNPTLLESKITNHYNQRIKTLKKRLARAAFYSTLSIFLTNIVSLLLIEMPFNKWVTGYFFNYIAIGVDILVPTFLMLLLVITIKPPRAENLPRVIMEVMKITYGKGQDDVYEIKKPRKINAIFEAIINLFYLLGFFAIVATMVWLLAKINFPPLSYVIFIIFLSLIAFAGSKIRQRAKELQVIEERDTLIHLLIDPFSTPIVQLGKWLTSKWQKYNFIAIFFSALIDMPFNVFIEFIEQWRYFLKEKKEKIH